MAIQILVFDFELFLGVLLLPNHNVAGASRSVSYIRLMNIDVFLIALLVSSLALLLYYLCNVSNEKREFLWRFDNAETGIFGQDDWGFFGCLIS